MSLHECQFCYDEKGGIFSIEVPQDEPEHGTITRYVCGNCWDVIAEIARRVIDFDRQKMIDNV